jgi:hypothetical protein
MLPSTKVNSKKLFICTLCLSLLIIPLQTFASSGSLGGFVVDDSSKVKKVAQRRSIGSGTRSECKNTFAKNAITLMVPQEQVVHKTASQTPSFYIRSKTASKTPLKFSLVNPEVSEPVAEKSISLSPGINKIELPAEIKLAAGKIYLWYVAIPTDCKNSSTQYQDILTSSVKVTPASDDLQNLLTNANTETHKATIYAQNGYWYDSLQISIDHKLKFLNLLLNSVNLTS